MGFHHVAQKCRPEVKCNDSSSNECQEDSTVKSKVSLLLKKISSIKVKKGSYRIIKAESFTSLVFLVCL